MNSFESHIEKGIIKIDTVVDHPYIEHGINLSGTIYIEGLEQQEEVEDIRLEVCKKEKRELIAKLSFEPVGNPASKGTLMIPFEIMPDERWVPEEGEEATQLVLTTTAFFSDGSSLSDEDELIFDIEE